MHVWREKKIKWRNIGRARGVIQLNFADVWVILCCGDVCLFLLYARSLHTFWYTYTRAVYAYNWYVFKICMKEVWSKFFSYIRAFYGKPNTKCKISIACVCAQKLYTKIVFQLLLFFLVFFFLRQMFLYIVCVDKSFHSQLFLLLLFVRSYCHYYDFYNYYYWYICNRLRGYWWSGQWV